MCIGADWPIKTPALTYDADSMIYKRAAFNRLAFATTVSDDSAIANPAYAGAINVG